ncbi:putative transaldolase [Anaplasma phagocytophilum]|uniref:hypothetical protein n=1 Tax=Anaplasma phagocytophilum TaxID=948 RepID=UPI0007E26956|nr:hypothetical protein [Anaplasma phagocytophilum]SCV63367.1 putative transaldolase [Anaplasma phagocytophilum]SCV64674.1 putative transaldolase [Anaplasma phagocytophilum]SCV65375.1 putative transaldolase [Anaplasma phagocytophilum]
MVKLQLTFDGIRARNTLTREQGEHDAMFLATQALIATKAGALFTFFLRFMGMIDDLGGERAALIRDAMYMRRRFLLLRWCEVLCACFRCC